jgi:hypothetical protein
MSTKTYIFEKDGDFIVSCYIECPSQPFAWIKSQQQEVIDSVNAEIEESINPTEEVEEKYTPTKTTTVTIVPAFAQPKSESTPYVSNDAMGIGSKYQHSKFGIGVVVEENEGLVSIDFPEIGVRKLIKKFVTLSKVA